MPLTIADCLPGETILQATIRRAREQLGMQAKAAMPSYGERVIAEAQAKKNAATGLVLNDQQNKAVQMAIAGESFCMIGSAGVGKTTTTKAMVHGQMQANKIPMLERGTKMLRQNTPGVVLIAYTRRAVRNIRRQMPDDFKEHCMTFHALVEYQPEELETIMPDGTVKRTKPFRPQRRKGNTLPANLRVIYIDEASMFSLDFFETLLDALPNRGEGIQFILIGDICQLPPIYGDGVLGLQMNQLPVVELTQVYRQALESPIIEYALAVKDNNIPKDMYCLTKDFVKETPAGKVSFIPWKKKLDMEDAARAIHQKLTAWVDEDFLNFDNDVILCPWGKSFGTIEMNKTLGTALARKNKREVYEIIAGFNKHYYSVGDKVIVNKMDATVVKIARNIKYLGKPPQPASLTMDYWGWGGTGSAIHETIDVDELLDAFADALDEVEDRVAQASHAMTVKFVDTEIETTLVGAAEFNATELAYAMSVHKAQGSEWKRVIGILHDCHSKMATRELIYTLMTRASKELLMILPPLALRKAAATPRIKGDTLEEKKLWFAARLREYNNKLKMKQKKLALDDEEDDE